MKPKLSGVQLLIHDLETTKADFIHTVLYKKRNGKCMYCAEGILLSKAGVSDDALIRSCYIGDVRDAHVTEKVVDRYGFDISKEYEDHLLCPICKKAFIASFEDFIVHANDTHSASHKDVAMYVKMFSKKYNPETGDSVNEK